MTKPVENCAEPSRRPWWRFFVQFSLRTLLLVTTIVAIGCWWFLRPETYEEQLAGKFLKLRRQVRLAKVDPNESSRGATRGGLIGLEQINVGRWELFDDQGTRLVAGRYDRDLPEGWWTIYHANGRTAVLGKVLHGAKTGLWRVWNDSGRLTNEVHYRTDSLSHQAYRHGPARVWHASGQPHFEGTYKDDRRDGTWTFYDEQGRVTEKREYRSGQFAKANHAP